MTWVWGGGGSEEQAAAKEQKVSPCNDSSENTALKKKKLNLCESIISLFTFLNRNSPSDESICKHFYILF